MSPVMTYASEMFSWYAGSVEADTYSAPSGTALYFGGFGMKTAPAMGKRNYSISTSLTGDSGEAFLAALTATQRKHITDLVDLQRQDLAEIVHDASGDRDPSCAASCRPNPPTRTGCCPCPDDTASWTAPCRTSTPPPSPTSARR